MKQLQKRKRHMYTYIYVYEYFNTPYLWHAYDFNVISLCAISFTERKAMISSIDNNLE